MKPLRCPWRFAGKIFLIPTGIFALLIIGALFFEHVLEIYVPFWAVYSNFIIQGGVWTAISVVFFSLSAVNSKRIERLKAEGEQFSGTIEDIRPVMGVRIMHYLTARADCSYMNAEQKKCLVRSKAYLFGSMYPLARHGRTRGEQSTLGFSPENFSVNIYVSYSNPHDYAVEILEQKQEAISADYDYR
jgi:hypothetical protein